MSKPQGGAAHISVQQSTHEVMGSNAPMFAPCRLTHCWPTASHSWGAGLFPPSGCPTIQMACCRCVCVAQHDPVGLGSVWHCSLAVHCAASKVPRQSAVSWVGCLPQAKNQQVCCAHPYGFPWPPHQPAHPMQPQELHCDNPHGPFAFVLSLTREQAHTSIRSKGCASLPPASCTQPHSDQEPPRAALLHQDPL